MVKVLLTGAKGFVGSSILAKINYKYQVIGMGRTQDTAFGIDIHPSDRLQDLSFEPDIVIACHAAVNSGTVNTNTKELYSSNIELTETLVKNFKKSFFIYISSVSVYGNSYETITETSKLQPQSEYACSKLWAENIVLNNVDACVVRLSSVYGDGMTPHTIIPKYVDQALTNREISVWGTGQRKQNYIHVHDVCHLIEKIIENKHKTNKIVLLGVSPTEYTNLELAEYISGVTGAKIKFLNNDTSISFKYDASYTNNILDINKYTDLSEGIKNYISWKKKAC